MKTKIIVSLLVVAGITLSFSFISINKVTPGKKSVTTRAMKSDTAPVGGLASSDKLD